MSKSLPTKPNLEHLKNQAKQLLKAYRAGDKEAAKRFQQFLPRVGSKSLEEIQATRATLQEAQHVVACEYGFSSWAEMVAGWVPSSDRPTAADPVPRSYCLRIMSTVKGREIGFTGTIMVSHGACRRYVLDQQTPFELQVETVLLGGTVGVTSEHENLQVEVLGAVDGKFRRVTHGEGRHFLFAEHVAPHAGPRFIWVF